MNIKRCILIALAFISLVSCNHSKPKPISKDITKTAVMVNGRKDSVINNPEKNYGNATVAEPCVKCLIAAIQKTDSYKNLTSAIPNQNMMYDVNWITSSKPMDIGNGDKIVNGMDIVINLKGTGSTKKLVTYLYNNENAQFYLLDNQNKLAVDLKADSISLIKIRNACFWGVASAK